MKVKFSEIIVNYLDSFNLFEHLCIAFAFLEFIFFLISRDIPLAIHISLVLFIPIIIYIKSSIHKKSNNKKILNTILQALFCCVLVPIIIDISNSYATLGIYIDLNTPILIAILFLIACIMSIYIRKSNRAVLKSLIIIGVFSILFSVNILYNNSRYISNPQLRKHLDLTLLSKQDEEKLALDITYLRIGNKQITDLKDIEKFENLKELYIDGNVRNIEGLFKLEKLEEIGFYFSDSNLLYEINKFKTLKFLTLDFMPPMKKDFILSDVPNLLKLKIVGGDIDFLGNLDSLKLLDLAFMDLENVATIKNLKSLKVLKLNKVNIDNIDGILSNNSIEKIHYENSNIEDYEDILKEKGIKLVKTR